MPWKEINATLSWPVSVKKKKGKKQNKRVFCSPLTNGICNREFQLGRVTRQYGRHDFQSEIKLINPEYYATALYFRRHRFYKKPASRVNRIPTSALFRVTSTHWIREDVCKKFVCTTPAFLSCRDTILNSILLMTGWKSYYKFPYCSSLLRSMINEDFEKIIFGIR